MKNLVLLAGAVLSSSFLTSIVTNWFNRGRAKVETGDILTEAAAKSLEVMRTSMDYQAQQIEELRERVLHLESIVAQYHDLHGPLPVA